MRKCERSPLVQALRVVSQNVAVIRTSIGLPLHWVVEGGVVCDAGYWAVRTSYPVILAEVYACYSPIAQSYRGVGTSYKTYWFNFGSIDLGTLHNLYLLQRSDSLCMIRVRRTSDTVCVSHACITNVPQAEDGLELRHVDKAFIVEDIIADMNAFDEAENMSRVMRGIGFAVPNIDSLI
jgi:hypothetical protein